jgi:hypothetical protein
MARLPKGRLVRIRPRYALGTPLEVYQKVPTTRPILEKRSRNNRGKEKRVTEKWDAYRAEYEKHRQQLPPLEKHLAGRRTSPWREVLALPKRGQRRGKQATIRKSNLKRWQQILNTDQKTNGKVLLNGLASIKKKQGRKRDAKPQRESDLERWQRILDAKHGPQQTIESIVDHIEGLGRTVEREISNLVRKKGLDREQAIERIHSMATPARAALDFEYTLTHTQEGTPVTITLRYDPSIESVVWSSSRRGLRQRRRTDRRDPNRIAVPSRPNGKSNGK